MKSVFCAALFFFAFAALASANEDNDNWPCYLKKCNKKDPKINECLVRHANYALLSLYGGDEKLGIPDYYKYTLQNVTLGRFSTFKLCYKTMSLVGIGHVTVDSMIWDFATETVSIDFLYHNSLVVQGPYKSTGKFHDRPIDGEGVASLVFVGGNKGEIIKYKMQYNTIKVGGYEYVQMKNRQSVCTGNSMRIDFNNQLVSQKQAQDDCKFLNDNSKAAHEALRPEVQELFSTLVDQALNPIFYNFPLDMMFDNK